MKVNDILIHSMIDTPLFPQEEKQIRNELKKRMELERMAAWKNRLEEFESGHLPFMCLQYKDKDSVHHTIPAVFIGNLNSFVDQKIANMVSYFSKKNRTILFKLLCNHSRRKT
jgi:hypothetical protein